MTGATSGIGLETAVALARMGAQVVMVTRDPARGAAALAVVQARSGSSALSLLQCDLASQASVRSLAAEFRARYARLDVLVNNAGTVHAQREVTADGVERTFAVNHLAPFLLTNLLLDRLVERSRIVNVASVANRQGTMDFDNLQFEHGGYAIMRAYARSKLANVLFTAELARRLAGTGVTANCLHPGAVATNIWSHAPWFARPFLWVASRFMLRPEQGAARVVYLAADPALEGQTGGYYEDNRRVAPSPLAQDEALARRLWDVSARLVGLEDRAAPVGGSS